MPEAMIRALDRHGVPIVHLWGMTETSPLGSYSKLTDALHDADEDVQYRYRATQGRPSPFVEIRARNEDGLVAWDGETMGELEVRGPWVTSGYYESPETKDRITPDGWFRTGDIVTIGADGCIAITDRSKDLIKSGGEWISSVALENALMSHPAVLEAMVVGLAHPKWDERPLACVVRRDGCSCSAADLIAHLALTFPSWWMPNGVEFRESLPRTTVGKLDKKVVRQEYAGYFLPSVIPTPAAGARALERPVPS